MTMQLLENTNGEHLIVDCFGGDFYLDLMESTNPNLTKFKGKFQEAGAVNKNKRMYPYDVLNENVKKLQPLIEARQLIGELDHPTDSIVHFANASHLITRLWWENKVLMGEGEILNTPSGKLLRSLINDNVRVGISSRGVGNGKLNENGILVISEGYKLITFDVVSDPSTYDAYQQKVVSKATRTENKIPEVSQVKNESISIDTVTKEALIACLGSMVKSKVNEITKRLNNE